MIIPNEFLVPGTAFFWGTSDTTHGLDVIIGVDDKHHVNHMYYVYRSFWHGRNLRKKLTMSYFYVSYISLLGVFLIVNHKGESILMDRNTQEVWIETLKRS